jgi:hypothetical protein
MKFSSADLDRIETKLKEAFQAGAASPLDASWQGCVMQRIRAESSERPSELGLWPAVLKAGCASAALALALTVMVARERSDFSAGVAAALLFDPAALVAVEIF